MRGDDQINQPLQMYVLLLRNKQLFNDGTAHTHTQIGALSAASALGTYFFKCTPRNFIIINYI